MENKVKTEIEKFLKYASLNEAEANFLKNIKENLKYPKETLEKVVTLAKNKGFNFSIKDFTDYLAENTKNLKEEDLSNVGGGFGGGRFGKGLSLFATGIGLGAGTTGIIQSAFSNRTGQKAAAQNQQLVSTPSPTTTNIKQQKEEKKDSHTQKSLKDKFTEHSKDFEGNRNFDGNRNLELNKTSGRTGYIRNSENLGIRPKGEPNKVKEATSLNQQEKKANTASTSKELIKMLLSKTAEKGSMTKDELKNALIILVKKEATSANDEAITKAVGSKLDEIHANLIQANDETAKTKILEDAAVKIATEVNAATKSASKEKKEEKDDKKKNGKDKDKVVKEEEKKEEVEGKKIEGKVKEDASPAAQGDIEEEVKDVDKKITNLKQNALNAANTEKIKEGESCLVYGSTEELKAIADIKEYTIDVIAENEGPTKLYLVIKNDKINNANLVKELKEKTFKDGAYVYSYGDLSASEDPGKVDTSKAELLSKEDLDKTKPEDTNICSYTIQAIGVKEEEGGITNNPKEGYKYAGKYDNNLLFLREYKEEKDITNIDKVQKQIIAIQENQNTKYYVSSVTSEDLKPSEEKLKAATTILNQKNSENIVGALDDRGYETFKLLTNEECKNIKAITSLLEKSNLSLKNSVLSVSKAVLDQSNLNEDEAYKSLKEENNTGRYLVQTKANAEKGIAKNEIENVLKKANDGKSLNDLGCTLILDTSENKNTCILKFENEDKLKSFKLPNIPEITNNGTVVTKLEIKVNSQTASAEQINLLLKNNNPYWNNWLCEAGTIELQHNVNTDFEEDKKPSKSSTPIFDASDYKVEKDIIQKLKGGQLRIDKGKRLEIGLNDNWGKIFDASNKADSKTMIVELKDGYGKVDTNLKQFTEIYRKDGTQDAENTEKLVSHKMEKQSNELKAVQKQLLNGANDGKYYGIVTKLTAEESKDYTCTIDCYDKQNIKDLLENLPKELKDDKGKVITSIKITVQDKGYNESLEGYVKNNKYWSTLACGKGFIRLSHGIDTADASKESHTYVTKKDYTTKDITDGMKGIVGLDDDTVQSKLISIGTWGTIEEACREARKKGVKKLFVVLKEDNIGVIDVDSGQFIRILSADGNEDSEATKKLFCNNSLYKDQKDEDKKIQKELDSKEYTGTLVTETTDGACTILFLGGEKHAEAESFALPKKFATNTGIKKITFKYLDGDKQKGLSEKQIKTILTNSEGSGYVLEKGNTIKVNDAVTGTGTTIAKVYIE